MQRMAEERNVDYDENLTVDASQGQEVNIVIYMLVKPSSDTDKAGFVADLARLKVALSQAKKVLVIVGKLSKWNKAKRNELKKKASGRSGLAGLMRLFDDAETRKDVVKWTPQQHVPAASLVPPLTATPQVNPVVDSLEQLNIRSALKVKDSPRPARRRRTSDVSDTEMVTEGSSQALKRQRLESSVSSTPNDILTKVEDAVKPSEEFE